MTIVIEQHPFLDAAAASVGGAFFMGIAIFALVHALRLLRSPEKRRTGEWVRPLGVAVLGIPVIATFAIIWWLGSSPWSVDVNTDAATLHYVWSSVRVPYQALDRVEFEVKQWHSRGVRETHAVRLQCGKKTYEISANEKFRGDPDVKPVDELFEQLSRRVPPQIVRR